MKKIGLQLWTVKDAAQDDFLGTLRKIAEMGYIGAEFAGFYETAAEDVKKCMDEVGIKAAGSHTSIEQLENSLPEVLEYNKTIHNKYIICPWLPEEKRSTEEDYKKTAILFNSIGQICKEQGFVFAYHNHDFEFDRFGDTTGYEILLKYSDPEFVKFELDCYWVSSAGNDPLELLEKYPNRFCSLHIKDMTLERGGKRSTEIGSGSLNIESLINAGSDSGIEWFIVEQEQFDKDPIESCRISFENIRSFSLWEGE